MVHLITRPPAPCQLARPRLAWCKRNESAQCGQFSFESGQRSFFPSFCLLQGLSPGPLLRPGVERPHWPENAEHRCRKQSSTLVERGRPYWHANQAAGGFLGQALADTSVAAGPKVSLGCPEKSLGFLHVSQREQPLNGGIPCVSAGHRTPTFRCI